MRWSAIAVAALALLGSAVALPTMAAGAGGRTEIFTQGPDRFRSKPSRLYYGSPPFVTGVRYEAARLRWRGWGRNRARAVGRLSICTNMAPCRRFGVKVAASGLLRGAEGAPHNVYSYVSFTRRGRKRPLLELCVYAEVCRAGPVQLSVERSRASS